MFFETPLVGDGKVVTLNYTLRDDSGGILHHQSSQAPLAYLHGAGNIVPGLEKRLSGKRVGDRLAASIPPEEAYGEHSGPGPQPVPKSAFEVTSDLTPGTRFLAAGPSGETMTLWIAEIRGETVYVDHVHPLAGQTLHFDVEIVGVRVATEQELEAGQPL